MAKGLHRLTNPAIISPNGIASPPSSFAHASANAFPFVGSAWSSTEVYEMRKRCWWTVWSLVLWAAYNTGRIPTIRADDPRVQTEMPACSDPDVSALCSSRARGGDLEH